LFLLLADLTKAALDFEKICVDLNILLPFLGNGRFLENSRHRAGRFARATVNALVRIDIELLAGLESRLALSRMDAVYRADIDTGSIFHTHAWLGNYIGHSEDILLLARHVREAIDPWYMTAKCLVVGGVGTRDKRTFQWNGLATFTTSWANPSQGRDKKQFSYLILGQRCNEPRIYNCRALEVASRAVFSGGQ
jgi:hypothetical protein